jgi:hypothetical protein
MSSDPTESFFMEYIKYGRLRDVGFHEISNYHFSWPIDEDPNGTKVPETQIRDLYSAYIKALSGGKFSFHFPKFNAKWKRFFGRGNHSVTESTSLEDYRGRSTRIITLPSRRELLEYSLKRGMISQQEYDFAFVDTDSHLPEHV